MEPKLSPSDQTDGVADTTPSPGQGRRVTAGLVGASLLAGAGLTLTSGPINTASAAGAAFLLLVACALVVSGLGTWARSRDPRRPREPRPRKARRRRVPREPASQVHEIAHRCVICNRPLTNAQSMRARVGSTCIKRYGPRYKLIPNPEHARWRGLVAAADADRAAEQASFNVAHQRAMADHQTAVARWEQERTSSAGRARAVTRCEGRRRLQVSALAVPGGLIVGNLLAALVL